MYAYSQDVPVDAAFYQKVRQGLGDDPPKGLITHLAIELQQGGLRYLDVWETEQDCERFVEDRLHPVVHPLLEELFGGQRPPEPERTPLSVIDAWTQS